MVFELSSRFLGVVGRGKILVRWDEGLDCYQLYCIYIALVSKRQNLQATDESLDQTQLFLLYLQTVRVSSRASPQSIIRFAFP
jgi:hypothetical protein